jgi:hypothetical protein
MTKSAVRGRTTLAAHIIFFAAELGLKVAGASIDEANNLRPWMRLAGIPWVDALCDDLPSDVDLLVIDVGQGARSVEVRISAIVNTRIGHRERRRPGAKRRSAVALEGALMGVQVWEGPPSGFRREGPFSTMR